MCNDANWNKLIDWLIDWWWTVSLSAGGGRILFYQYILLKQVAILKNQSQTVFTGHFCRIATTLLWDVISLGKNIVRMLSIGQLILGDPPWIIKVVSSTRSLCNRRNVRWKVNTPLCSDRPPCFLLGSEFSSCCPSTFEGFNMIIGQYLKFSPGSFYVLPHYFRTKVYSMLGLVPGLQTTPTTSSYILMQKFILTNVFLCGITYIYYIWLPSSFTYKYCWLYAFYQFIH